MTTALRMIKGELGPEAVILSARSLRRGKGFFGSMKYAGVEVTAAIDNQKSKILSGNSMSAKKEYANLLNRPTVYGILIQSITSANRRPIRAIIKRSRHCTSKYWPRAWIVALLPN